MLTDRQREILSYIQSKDMPPTVREIAARFRKSTGTIAQHLRRLREGGFLASDERHARSLKLANSFRERQQPLLHVPLYGSIPAGFADERHQEAEGCVSVDAASLGLRPSSRFFALRVKGDSLVGKHILPGDIAILEHGREPSTGDTVAALIDGESTLKLYQNNRGKPFLRAANPRYADLVPERELVVPGRLGWPAAERGPMSLYMTATAETLRQATVAAPLKPVSPAAADPMRPPMSLGKARHYAAKITEWLAPFCRQIEPVGEIRRRCSTVAAIELLVMPRFEANANKLFDFLHDYIENHATGGARWLHCTGRTDLRGVRPGHYDDSITVLLPRCKLVLHTAIPDNWFLRLFESTGSAAHVASIMERVRSLPGTWEPGEQIRVRSKPVKPLSEGHIYDVLNMEMVVPWRREH